MSGYSVDTCPDWSPALVRLVARAQFRQTVLKGEVPEPSFLDKEAAIRLLEALHKEGLEVRPCELSDDINRDEVGE
jgi:hypothetical protein